MVRKQWFRFNNAKILSVLYTSKRIIYVQRYLMKSNGIFIKQKPTAKLLGTTFDCNLTWNEQINIITKSIYDVLFKVLKNFKRFTPFKNVIVWLNHLLYHELIITMLFTVKCLIILLRDYSEFTTVLHDICFWYICQCC